MLKARARFLRPDRSVLRSMGTAWAAFALATSFGVIVAVAWTWSRWDNPLGAVLSNVGMFVTLLAAPVVAVAALVHALGAWIRPPRRWIRACALLLLVAWACSVTGMLVRGSPLEGGGGQGLRYEASPTV